MAKDSFRGQRKVISDQKNNFRDKDKSAGLLCNIWYSKSHWMLKNSSETLGNFEAIDAILSTNLKNIMDKIWETWRIETTRKLLMTYKDTTGVLGMHNEKRILENLICLRDIEKKATYLKGWSKWKWGCNWATVTAWKNKSSCKKMVHRIREIDS